MLTTKKVFTLLFVITLFLTMNELAFSETFTVTNLNNDGAGSLREAIELANYTTEKDLIEFNISSGAAPYRIMIETILTPIVYPVEINGYSQPGASPATSTSPAVIKIVLDGSISEGWHEGLTVEGDNCIIKGLVISFFGGPGITVRGDGNIIEGNYIGTDHTGTLAQGNDFHGIFIQNGNDNIIGGLTPSARNVISDNGGAGVGLNGASGNRVIGNFVGTDASGMMYLPNDGRRQGWPGINMNNAGGNFIGGLEPGARNVVTNVNMVNPGSSNNQVMGNYIGLNLTGNAALSPNMHSGILVSDATNNIIGPKNIISGFIDAAVILISGEPWQNTSNNKVIGNLIGTDPTGTNPIPNKRGIQISNAFYNRIGGEAAEEGNIIAYNKKDEYRNGGTGIAISASILDNDYTKNNRIIGNSIFSNEGLGIDLQDDGFVQPNDPGDGDDGPNNLMNFPVLTSARATPGRLIVKGYIDSPNPTKITLEFFTNSEPDPTGYGEGEIFLGTAKPNANGKFTAALSAVSPGTFISATATDKDNNTSEFAENIEATGPGQLGKSIADQEISSVPLEFALAQNHPNPFNPETEISFQIPEAMDVVLIIYNTLGQEIYTLLDGRIGEGYHTIKWDSKDSKGNPVPSGIYIYKLIADNFSVSKKMDLVR